MWLDLGLSGSGPAEPRFQLGHCAIESRVVAFGKHASLLRPVLRVLRQAVEYQLLDLARHPARKPQLVERGSVFGGVSQQDVHARWATERQAAGQELIHHHADRVEVAAMVHFLAPDLFGADVAGCADREIDVGIGHLAERLAIY